MCEYIVIPIQFSYTYMTLRLLCDWFWYVTWHSDSSVIGCDMSRDTQTRVWLVVKCHVTLRLLCDRWWYVTWHSGSSVIGGDMSRDQEGYHLVTKADNMYIKASAVNLFCGIQWPGLLMWYIPMERGKVESCTLESSQEIALIKAVPTWCRLWMFGLLTFKSYEFRQSARSGNIQDEADPWCILRVSQY
jgi:hypothetical protein